MEFQININKINNLTPEIIADELKNKRNKIYFNIIIMENKDEKISYIPVFNKRKEIVDYTIINNDIKEEILKYSYSLFNVKNCDDKIINKYSRSKLGFLHRNILKNTDPSKHVDHINNIGLDNRRENLRIASISQNIQNRKKRENCSSQYLGVTKKKQRWSCRIAISGKTVCIGSYESEYEAGRAYDFNAYSEYGEFCKNNNLLTDEEKINGINKQIPEKYQRKKDRDLPYGIGRDKKYFRLRIQRGKMKIDEFYLNLEKAIEARDKFLNKLEEEKRKEEEIKYKEIKRNEEGIPIILAHCKGEYKECKVDEHVWKDVAKFAWQYNNKGRIFKTTLGKGSISIHQYIYYNYVLSKENFKEGETVDHIGSENKFDARISNLRVASKSLQSHNQKKIEGIDKYNGVHFDYKKFIVVVKNTCYGRFDTEEEAAYVANKAAILEFGENAKLNDIDMTKTTTWENRITDEMITENFVKNIKYVKDLKNLVMRLALNVKNGGNINIMDIKSTSLEKYKKIVIDYLNENK